ncbi:hypothetical conserved protein [Candidatus Nitrosoglobus terrae]|uniref:Hypothetical conserved protein n=1 Tax=Candidatus Nitrosoglobus terrae TaxID=1630141 RepID=A0A1Q2SPJ8_9GAMM|nr:DUF2249 domain-containing protein [Candidatus Nitrosoglobus terrae]BAW81027.1 hypothetical conserved protein [Candidatus Nitrosoglobus terrae]
MGQHTSKATIDVRSIPPQERHPLIFRTFDDLELGESLLLINDHDPKPLYYQLQHSRGKNFDWQYLENGPSIWQVQISKTS